jgi:hypothetical protein
VTVVAKEGNAIQVQTPDGVKMRNVAHAKKFVPSSPPPVLDLDAETETPKDTADPPGDPPDTVVRKSGRTSVKPVYLKDYA